MPISRRSWTHWCAAAAYGAEVRVETADSGFPARAFVLPVRTAVLVGWPMLQGAGAAVLAWVIWDRLVLRPWLSCQPRAGARRGRRGPGEHSPE